MATTEFYADWLAMIKVLMGLAVFMFAILGFLLSSRKAKPLLMGGWVGYVIYGLIFPYQYVTHEYYHLPLVALVAASVPPLLEGIVNKFKEQHWIWRALAIGVFIFASGYSLYVARSIMYASDFQYEPLSWQRVGEALPENAPFIALSADYGMRLRYYGWRSSITWPSSGDIRLMALSSEEEFNFQAYFDQLTEGKDYFLVTSFSEFDAQPELKDYLNNNYQIHTEGNGFLIFDLTQSQQN
jgi:hypothetical protein